MRNTPNFELSAALSAAVDIFSVATNRMSRSVTSNRIEVRFFRIERSRECSTLSNSALRTKPLLWAIAFFQWFFVYIKNWAVIRTSLQRMATWQRRPPLGGELLKRCSDLHSINFMFSFKLFLSFPVLFWSEYRLFLPGVR